MISLDEACRTACRDLLAERNAAGHWVGELSASALSTATAVMALLQVRRKTADASRSQFIDAGVDWLLNHRNPDGGWGDTLQSHSNIATTMLCRATLAACADDVGKPSDRLAPALSLAQSVVEKLGGTQALAARYGRDRTFSIPILTHCALAGLIPWRQVAALPFELACLPADFYKWVRLPVVSYALPALIAIGQARHFHAPSRNPLLRGLRQVAVERTLAVLARIQPATGGYLEATPLTSFVAMSLASIGRAEHPVVRGAMKFLEQSVRADGSWPIDTNLATWVTTLAINALGADLPQDSRAPLRTWLLQQQWTQVHPYTNASPGGWAWTDLSGGVPDADDTPGALLALVALAERGADPDVATALTSGCRWLIDLQNSDGGWPTFCRGWGTLPFDRSAPDLTAHALRAIQSVHNHLADESGGLAADLVRSCRRASNRGIDFLRKTQHADGGWRPLWFGNQDAPDDENPTYGTAKVLLALSAVGDVTPKVAAMRARGRDWLLTAQNADGGFGAGTGTVSSVEETALAVEALAALPAAEFPQKSVERGAAWLVQAVASGGWREPSPIGFYFAKLWYFEKLYPLLFCVAALRKVRDRFGSRARES